MMAVSPITIEDVEVISGEIKQCLNVMSTVKRGKKVSRDDFFASLKSVTTDFYSQFISPGFHSEDSEFNAEDEEVYLKNMKVMTTFVMDNYPDKLIKVGSNTKGLPKIDDAQAMEIRKSIKKGVHQLGIIRHSTGNFQLAALLAVLCAAMCRGNQIDTENLIQTLKPA